MRDPKHLLKIKQEFEAIVKVIDQLYPKIRINMLILDGAEFNSTNVEVFSQKVKMRGNRFLLLVRTLLQNQSNEKITDTFCLYVVGHFGGLRWR